MIQTEEQIFIVCSVKGTEESEINEAMKSIDSYKLSSSFVCSVITKPYVFRIPSGNTVGSTLNSELVKQLQKSIGAIIFVDDLRPNIAYELGFFHGQGKPVLLITNGNATSTWDSISDLAGCFLLNKKDKLIEKGIHEYLDLVYETLSNIPILNVPELPLSENNVLKRLVENCDPDFHPIVYFKEFGETIKIDTWGGFLFNTNINLLPDAKFKIVLRKLDINSHYSIYFRIRFINSNNERRKISLGITSTRSNTGFEANERNLPAQPISKNWCLLTYSFKNLLTIGQVLGKNRIECLENVRFRAGDCSMGISPKHPAYEIGYFEIIGKDY